MIPGTPESAGFPPKPRVFLHDVVRYHFTTSGKSLDRILERVDKEVFRFFGGDVHHNLSVQIEPGKKRYEADVLVTTVVGVADYEIPT